ncbi:MAG: DUF4011 domain-containing protein, partial [Methanobrevibacter sp.]|nr:DUF4011 domain-containing protein [Methanobrevibacter sp.]
MNSSSSRIIKEFENLREKLLDLSSKNQLLNFKPRAKTLEIIENNPNNIYHTLIIQKKKMYFIPNKASENDIDYNKPKSRLSKIFEYAPIDLSIFKSVDTTLKTDLSPTEMQKRLFYINQQARLMLNEQGYNILYLAVGFLEWKDQYKVNEIKKAPLVLIPVTLSRKKAGKSCTIEWNGDEIETNISIKEKLLNEGVKLPKFKMKNYVELIEDYLLQVKTAISKGRSTKKWNINTEIALGFFSFTKFLMYEDLNPDGWKNLNLDKHSLIDSLFNPKGIKEENEFREDDIDKILNYASMYQVLDADSSQIAAIENVKSGENLVVEGPPGTGKSQTIVNLIAELLANGKTVLFVSEKMAALDVVRDRLKSVGLGKFVLELHSNQTRKKKILKDLEKSLNTKFYKNLEVDSITTRLDNLKLDLDDYAEILHKKSFAYEISPFQLFGLKEVAYEHFYKTNRHMVLVNIDNPENISKKELDSIIADLNNLTEIHNTVSDNNPWTNCYPKTLLPRDLREIEQFLEDSLIALNQFFLNGETINELYGIKKAKDIKSYKETLQGLKLLEDRDLELVDSKIITNNSWKNESKIAIELIDKLKEYQDVSKVLSKFNDSIYNVDLDNLIFEFQKHLNKKFKLFSTNPSKDEALKLYKSSPLSKISGDKSILKDLKSLKSYFILKDELDSLHDLGVSFFGELYSLNANTSDLEKLSGWIIKFNKNLENGTFNNVTLDLLKNSLFDLNGAIEIKDYLESGNKFFNKLRGLENKLNPRSKLIFKKEKEEVSFREWENQINLWKTQLPSLHLFSQYLNTKRNITNPVSIEFIKVIE